MNFYQGELEHRRVKRFYSRTNKNKAARQIARQQRREEAMRKRKERIYKTLKRKNSPASVTAEESKTLEALNYTPPDYHHHISHSPNFPCIFPQWLQSKENDPAMKVRFVFARGVRCELTGLHA